MNIEAEPDFLSASDLEERINLFRAGPHTLERASDIGLLALAVPPRFGGLYINPKSRYDLIGKYFSYPRISMMRLPIRDQLHVCDEVLDLGTPAQYDLFLPQLAAGKRIALGAFFHNRITLRAERYCKNFLLSGDTLVTRPPTARTLVIIRAMFNGKVQHFLIQGEMLPNARPLKNMGYGRVFLQLREHPVPLSTMLGATDEGKSLTTEKWEAIRWNRDRSAS